MAVTLVGGQQVIQIRHAIGPVEGVFIAITLAGGVAELAGGGEIADIIDAQPASDPMALGVATKLGLDADVGGAPPL